METPAAQGYAMPPEWAPQAAVWLTWPLNPETWPGRLPLLQETWARLTAALAPFVPVRINVAGPAQAEVRRLCAAAGADLARVELFDVPADDVWVRDHGPLFLKDAAGRTAIASFRYNAWGGKYPHARDADIPARLADLLGLPLFASPLVAEGGGLELSGAGLCLTTESVLLNPNRNPGWGRAAVEGQLRDFLGVRDVFWLGGGLENDDTDGHIDTITRFFRPDALVTVVEPNPREANYRPLMENRERLQDLRSPTGGRCEIVDLPLPEPLVIAGWRVPRLPGTYANFLVTNGAVFVPTYRQPKRDAHACGLLGEIFPGRRIVPFDCLDIVQEGGALHCLTQQQPA